MKNCQKSSIIVIAFTFFGSITAFGQPQTEPPIYFTSPLKSTPKGGASARDDGQPHILYKIELTNSKEPLDLNDPIFALFGTENIKFQQSFERGFTYYIGSFSSEADAFSFLQAKSILKTYTQAKIVKDLSAFASQ